MKFNIIDFENWNRKEHFETYIKGVPCTYSVTGDVEITSLLNKVKENGYSFYGTVIYGISKIVNSHNEFKMNFDNEGNLGYFDTVYPSYTIFHKDSETFSDIWTEYNNDFNKFYNNYSNDLNEYKDNYKMSPKNNISNVFNISSIPWYSFKGFNLNLKNGYNYLPPIFTIGKYYELNKKVFMPLSLQVHHGVCDGFHVARFFNEFQDWANDF